MGADGGTKLEAGWRANLRYDLPAGLVVFLVALPLCLGIALASNAPLFAGVVSGVVGGLIVAPLSGSNLSVSGPAAGLTVLVAGGIASLGSYEAFLPAVVLAGVMQIVIGLARGGSMTNLFPVSVVEGMLAGIGIILILKQIPHALGRDTDYEGDTNFWMMGHQSHTFSEIDAAVRTASPGVLLVTLLCLGVLLLWQQPIIAKRGWALWIPGPLVAVAVGIGVNHLYSIVAPELFIRASEGHMVSLPLLSGPADLLATLSTPDWSALGRSDTWTVAATLAAVASLESLLSVEAVDKLDPFRRTSDSNRELLAQGVGNTVSGLLGGLPLTAVIVRSSANVYAGGRTRTSAIAHGVLLVALVLAIPHVLNRIPLASLAAILLVVGYKLARVELFKKVYRQGADQFLPFLVTTVVTVFSDLLMGVFAGFVLGVVMVIITNHHSAIAVVRDGDAWLIRFTANVSFLNKTRLRNVLCQVPDGAEVIVDGAAATHIDHDILALVEDFEHGAPHRNISVEVRHMASKAHPIRLPGM